jgi:hypothetical protein
MHFGSRLRHSPGTLAHDHCYNGKLSFRAGREGYNHSAGKLLPQWTFAGQT